MDGHTRGYVPLYLGNMDIKGDAMKHLESNKCSDGTVFCIQVVRGTSKQLSRRMLGVIPDYKAHMRKH